MKLKDYLSQNFWLCWCLALLTFFLISLSTITVSPTVWMDEVQIVDYGRTIFDPNTDWSITWLVSDNRPLILTVYLGPFLQNLTYQIFGSPLGPRLASSIGAMLAATVCVGFLISLKTPKWIAFVLGLVFFLDPIFISSYRGARVDCWAIGLCFLACWTIRHQSNLLASNIATKRPSFLLAGICISAMLFIWPTAIFLTPLIATEGFQFYYLSQKSKGRTIFEIFPLDSSITLLFTGIFLGLLVISLPILPELISGIQTILSFSKSDSLAVNFADKFKSDLRHFLTSLSLSPFVLLGGITAALTLRYKQKSLAAFLVLGLVIFSKPYGQRFVYLIPYLIVIIALFFADDSNMQRKTVYRLQQLFLIILLIWSITISLGVRNLVALSQFEGRNPERIFLAADNAIGKGDYKVLIPYELYYAGRTLGWKVYNSFSYIKSPSDRDYKKFLSQMDYIITTDRADQHNYLANDFVFKGEINSLVANEQNKFFFGRRPFPIYYFYEKQK
jgi:hypothetical protein